MEDCLFCMIAKGDIPSNKVYEDESVLAFRDINPQAPTHILVIPKEHIADSAAQITAENSAAVAHIFEVIAWTPDSASSRTPARPPARPCRTCISTSSPARTWPKNSSDLAEQKMQNVLTGSTCQYILRQIHSYGSIITV